MKLFDISPHAAAIDYLSDLHRTEPLKRDSKKFGGQHLIFLTLSSSPPTVMDATDMTPLLEQLEDDIDEVEEVLQPLLGRALSVTAQKMPVMDRAKLHVLLTYAIESLLFCMPHLHLCFLGLLVTS